MAQFDNGQASQEVSLYGKNVLAGDTPVSVDSSGRVNTNLSSALPSGSNIIGGVKLVDSAGVNQVSIDASGILSVKFQTPQSVTVSSPLPAGSNLIGGTNLVDSAGVNKAAIDLSGNLSVRLGAPLPSGSNTIGNVNTGAPLLVSLNSVTAIGAGASTNFSSCRKTFGLQVISTGAPTTLVVNIEGSIDGAHWFRLASWNSGMQSSGDCVFTSDVPVYSVRANLATLTGGTTPTISAYVSAA